MTRIQCQIVRPKILPLASGLFKGQRAACEPLAARSITLLMSLGVLHSATDAVIIPSHVDIFPNMGVKAMS